MDQLLDANDFRKLIEDSDQDSALAQLESWTRSDASVTSAGWEALQELPLHYVKMAQQDGEGGLLGLDGLDVLVGKQRLY